MVSVRRLLIFPVFLSFLIWLIFVTFGSGSAGIANDSGACAVPSKTYTTIQSAVNDPVCATILVAAGHFTENIVIERIVEIVGQGADQTILDGGYLGRVITASPQAVVTLTSVRIINGSASHGGGIHNEGDFTLKGSEIRDNTAAIDGGGIFNRGAMVIERSAVLYNEATYFSGGGIRNESFSFNKGQLLILNTTVSYNVASFSGGGISNEDEGHLRIVNSTVSGNEGVGGGVAGNEHGTGYLELQNSIVAGNFQAGSNTPQDCGRQIISNGHNLIGTLEGCNFQASTGDLTGVSAGLGSLQLNGGTTPTHALEPASPAIDAGDTVVCPTVDQRGILRPYDGDGDGNESCDIGAFEFEALTLHKAAPASAASGEPITYTLTVANHLTSNVTSLVITDVLPIGASYVAGGTLVGNVVSWTISSLSGGQLVEREFVVTASETVENLQYGVITMEGFAAFGNTPVITTVPKNNYLYLPIIRR